MGPVLYVDSIKLSLWEVILYGCCYYFNCYKLPSFTPRYVVSTSTEMSGFAAALYLNSCFPFWMWFA